ncbi:hypothetical protein L5515_016414 [Caenorhabditis briggsae]|uniref:Uncharacterized protein n=1 Tax=Caenorhabditis briggsae TaxID=6238 RepID=A0AAE9FD89_CAEBR|nr:hypothetical protein L5515_016414 [Caenorhabditis briggsae]
MAIVEEIDGNPSDELSEQANAPFMSLRQIKACGHLLLGTLQLRCESHGSPEDPRKEAVMARVFIKKRLRMIPETDDKNSRDYVLRSLYNLLDTHFAVIFKKIGQISGELAFLSGIQHSPEFDSVELQFVWACDYLFKSGQLEEVSRGDFIVPETPEFEMPPLDDVGEEAERNFMAESEMELRRQLEGYLSIEGKQ